MDRRSQPPPLQLEPHSQHLAPGEPSRPPRSPLRPRPRRANSFDQSQRNRADSTISLEGLQQLRNALQIFRNSLRTQNEETTEREAIGDREREGQVVNLPIYWPGQPSPQRSPSPAASDMSLADQRSARRLLDSLLQELRPHDEYVISPRVKSVRRDGHQRAHSLPSSVTSSGYAGESEGSKNHSTLVSSLSPDRRRTMSYTTSEPMVDDQPRPSVSRELGWLAGKITRSASGPMRDHSDELDQEEEVSPIAEAPPIVTPTIQVVEPRLSSLPPPPLESPPTSPPGTSPTSPSSSSPTTFPSQPPEVRVTRPSLSLSESSSYPTDGSSKHARPSLSQIQTSPVPVIQVTPSRTSGMHPFAAVVAMMENGDSPTRRRASAGKISPKGSLTSLKEGTKKLEKPPPSPKLDKGKGRDPGETPGRKQTPRRAYIGPGGVVDRIRSKGSLPKIHTSHDSTFKLNPPPTPPMTSTPITATSATFLRPAPATPLPMKFVGQRYALSSLNTTPTSSTAHSPLPMFAPTEGSRFSNGPVGEGMVEIPRFKLKDLNLGIVRRYGRGSRVAWIGLWGLCIFNGLIGLLFDVNVIYMLIQCAIHPSLDSHSASWSFAVAAYAVCWAISLAVWLCWELGYEFYRRWRLPRPAIEPIFFSYPASLYLSLVSYPHFTFLSHIRLSSLGTITSRDIIPETFHFLIQIGPSLLPLLPRAALSIVLLLFYSSSSPPSTPLDSSKDSHFFTSTGQLTSYARGVLLTFDAWVAIRLVIVLSSIIGLWLSSSKPLGGIFRNKSFSKKEPTTPRRKAKSSLPPPRDPSGTKSPQKSWYEAENEFHFVWRDRTRSRIQDAFELCLIRPGRNGSTTGIGIAGDFAWAARRSPTPGTPNTHFTSNTQNNQNVHLAQNSHNTHNIHSSNNQPTSSSLLNLPTSNHHVTRNYTQGRSPSAAPLLGEDNGDGLEELIAADLNLQKNDKNDIKFSPLDRPRPESMLLPRNTPPRSENVTASAGSSKTDLFYTPIATPIRTTPHSEDTNNPIDQHPSSIPASSTSDIITNENQAPPSAFRPLHHSNHPILYPITPPHNEHNNETKIVDKLSDEGVDKRRYDDDKKIRSRSDSTYSKISDEMTDSPNTSKRRSSVSSPGHVLNRARSTSIGLLRKTAHEGGGLIRRVRSGTVGSGYSQVDDDEHDESPGLRVRTLGKRRSNLGLGIPGGGVIDEMRASTS
ncbi:hypothetical protein TREMEDRAFT_59529 [Tremella mesenterica DSM 1558]|uniref:uncharacterized protein n=1 Tax=Tremella mesenterica (strain ATCC 24925 / CBS 8224 / DSM 1558 / NBRC 9311 / NRRL Y-6157 / RJB 2259-6 / UBC 559-6) TaxID=578456 RepID=UPI0003F49A9E|nr:uncharacterized protein TREMEDRAFT_59529 [Tremella mesenterica DSM 1558]EIW73364.1 hypothetical protein TREMEDRAFT_59529 [Tremella mesenterica DSM 1558]